MDKSVLLGLGFDSNDGHLRITKGENFRLYGGSGKTHEKMQEKAIKFNDQLVKRGKTLDEVSTEEFYEIADKIGLKVIDNKKGVGPKKQRDAEESLY
ncbi:MAG: hypothetical protein ISS34_05505 [Candidatus Omnitrophica bacterium]|nr:hypothetical protein [Candidatus Omnitrophota bacterium]